MMRAPTRWLPSLCLAPFLMAGTLVSLPELRWSDPLFLAAPGPTSGAWQDTGLPWFSWEPNGTAHFAYMANCPQGCALKGRAYTQAGGWEGEQTLAQGFPGTPWAHASYATDGGHLVSWCSQGTGGPHEHPLLVRRQGGWQRLPSVESPQGTEATGYHFGPGGQGTLDHIATVPGSWGTWRVVAQDLKAGSQPQETFRFATQGARRSILSWRTGDGTAWCAAAVPGREGTEVVVERLGTDGVRSLPTTLGHVAGPVSELAGSAGDSGWAVVAWTVPTESRPTLHVRVRSLEGWLPEADLGAVDEDAQPLDERLAFADPDREGRLALAWVRDGHLVTAAFDPAQGWGPVEVQGPGADRGRWAVNSAGDRMLVWGRTFNTDVFWTRRWSPLRGWAQAESHPMPMGALPQPALFNDGTGLVAGLAGQPEAWPSRMRPWVMSFR